jgi:hypothetical protein
LAPNGTPVTTHERIGSPKRCPKTKRRKAAKAIKTGMDFVGLEQPTLAALFPAFQYLTRLSPRCLRTP